MRYIITPQCDCLLSSEVVFALSIFYSIILGIKILRFRFNYDVEEVIFFKVFDGGDRVHTYLNVSGFFSRLMQSSIRYNFNHFSAGFNFGILRHTFHGSLVLSTVCNLEKMHPLQETFLFSVRFSKVIYLLNYYEEIVYFT